jgi:acyl dehydratase
VPVVSAGYDHVRFIAPVFIGDTLTVNYVCDQVDEAKMRTYGRIEVTNQKGELVMVATHILKYFEK